MLLNQNSTNSASNQKKILKNILFTINTHKQCPPKSAYRFKKVQRSSNKNLLNLTSDKSTRFIDCASARYKDSHKECSSLEKLRFTTINVDKFKKFYRQHAEEEKQLKRIQKRNREQYSYTCNVTILEVDKSSQSSRSQKNQRKQINFHITNFAEFVNYLKKRSSNSVIAYESVPKNLIIDYFLSRNDTDGSFLNGSSITLRPILRVKQQTIGLHSFQIIKCVGTGGFSKVFLCRFLEDGQFYAMKVIEKQEITKKKKQKILINELQILKKLKGSPFIIDLKFSFETKNYIVFVLEYCAGSEFFNIIKRFKRMSQEVARFYFIEILLGLQAIHTRNILYRDFKPENIIIDLHGHVRITDFGLSKPLQFQDQGRSYSYCGSPEYMPPQIIIKSGHSFTADFYSLGALLYQMLTGLPPFYSQKIQKIYEGTLYQKIKFPKNVRLSNQAKNLLQSLLNKDPKKRIGSLLGIKEILVHPWLGKINKKAFQSKEVTPPINFLSPEVIDFSFEEFQKENEFIEQLKEESRSKKESIFKAQFYYDGREMEDEDEELILLNDELQISRRLLENRKETSRIMMKKYAFCKKQNKVNDKKYLKPKRSFQKNKTMDCSGSKSTLRV